MSHSDKNKSIKKALLIQWGLIAYNVIEGIVSVFIGRSAGSIALVGFGFDSFIELSSASVLVWRLSHKGSEEAEGKKEKKALFFIGITFFVLAAYILFESISKLIKQEKPEATGVGIIIAALSLLIMPTLAMMKKKIGKQINSRALVADAMETLICSWLSFTLLLGLGLNAVFGWWWADPVAALVMVYFLVKEGREALSGEDTCCNSKCH